MSNTPTTQKIQRAYKVRIRPVETRPITAALLAAGGDQLEGFDADGWYEPREVTLWWDADKVPERNSTQEQREIARRAVRIECMEFHIPHDRDFEVQVLELTREQLVTPKPRKRKG